MMSNIDKEILASELAAVLTRVAHDVEITDMKAVCERAAEIVRTDMLEHADIAPLSVSEVEVCSLFFNLQFALAYSRELMLRK